MAYENAALNGIGRDAYTVRVGDILTDQALQAEYQRIRRQAADLERVLKEEEA